VDRSRAQILTVVVLALLALAGNALRAAAPRSGAALGLERVTAPGPYAEQALDREFRDALHAREVVYRIYSAPGGEPEWVFLGYFDRQQEGSQVHSPRHCYPGSGWNIESEPRWNAPWGTGRLASLVVNDGSERRLVVYWYQMDSRTETSVFQLKIEMTKRALLRRAQDVVFASISTPVGEDLDATMLRLAPMVQDVHSSIEQLYRERDEHRTRS